MATDTTQSITWSFDHPDQFEVLALPPRVVSSHASGISAAGSVAVMAETEDGLTRSYLFAPSGERTRLTGRHDGWSLEVSGIANGWAAGLEYDGAGHSHLVRIDLKRGRAEAVRIRGFEFDFDVNRSGYLVGRDLDGGVLYTDRVIKLPPLPDGIGSVAKEIDSRGRPTGIATTSDGFGVPVRWNCDLR